MKKHANAPSVPGYLNEIGIIDSKLNDYQYQRCEDFKNDMLKLFSRLTN